MNGCLPDEGQMLLLEAALGQGPEAAECWAEWERRFRLDRPDEGSYRLLPLVYRNLSGQGLERARVEPAEGNSPARLVGKPGAVSSCAAAPR